MHDQQDYDRMNKGCHYQGQPAGRPKQLVLQGQCAKKQQWRAYIQANGTCRYEREQARQGRSFFQVHNIQVPGHQESTCFLFRHFLSARFCLGAIRVCTSRSSEGFLPIRVHAEKHPYSWIPEKIAVTQTMYATIDLVVRISKQNCIIRSSRKRHLMPHKHHRVAVRIPSSDIMLCGGKFCDPFRYTVLFHDIFLVGLLGIPQNTSPQQSHSGSYYGYFQVVVVGGCPSLRS